jgi:hypothetical protein
MDGDINAKILMLNIFGLSMKGIVRIMNDGSLNHEDLKMMRILFGLTKQSEVKGKVSSVDEKILNFIGKFAEASLERHRSESRLGVQKQGGK